MASPPPPPPRLNPRRTHETDRDAPAEGRLANIGGRGVAQDLTRGGNTKMRFLPKRVARKTVDESAPKTDSLLATTSNTSSRGRGGRGRGREDAAPLPISGPFAAGPAGLAKRPLRALRSQGVPDSSLTVETAPVPVEPGTAVPVPIPGVKQEIQIPSKSQTTSGKKAPSKPRIKKEDDDGRDQADEFEEMEIDDRVDLAELNFPGGPISSRRKDDRNERGWKKVELWIEQENAEEITIDDDIPGPSQPTPIRVKVENDSMDIIIPEPETMVIEDDEDKEEKLRLAEKNRARRRRKNVKGKSREEKEELAREELDLEVLKDQFMGDDGTMREQKLFLVQLPLALPPLRNAADLFVKEEAKVEEPSAPTETLASIPSGKIGQLHVHASGKTVLSYGGIKFDIRLASDVAFAQDFVVVHPKEAGGGKAWRLGSVGGGEEGGWLIGVPELKGLHRK